MQHALIIGGSRGIGLATAQAFARQSYRITLLSRSEPSLQAALDTLPKANAPQRHSHDDQNQPFAHNYIAGDVAQPHFWTKEEFGSLFANMYSKGRDGTKIDVLVNCAGISQSKLFTATDPIEIQNIVDTNLTSMMLGTRFLLRNRYIQRAKSNKHPEDANTPVIINVASLLGLHGGYGATAYAASKAGVLGFTRALATETGASGIRVNAIVPGYVDTDMTKDLDQSALAQRIPLKRFGKPEEIASAALFLAQNEYAHNCVINLDGGLSAV